MSSIICEYSQIIFPRLRTRFRALFGLFASIRKGTPLRTSQEKLCILSKKVLKRKKMPYLTANARENREKSRSVKRGKGNLHKNGGKNSVFVKVCYNEQYRIVEWRVCRYFL
jgi:hypothetical protein